MTSTTDGADGADGAHRGPTMNLRVLAMVIFLLVVLLLSGAMHMYLWARLVRDPAWVAPWGRVGTAAFVALAASIPVAFVANAALPRSLGRVVVGAAFAWMGLAFLWFSGLVALDAARLVLRLVAGGMLADPSRRLFLSRAIAGVAGVAGVAAGAVGLWTALRRLEVRTVRVALRRLPASLAGTTIVQLTDVHVGPTIGRGFVEELVRRTNALAPDLVVITGDLVDGPVSSLGPLVAPLAGLRARHGVYFVTGNHEYYSGVDDWLAELGALGIRVLRNERVTIGEGAASFDLAGVDDWSAHRFGQGHGADLARALAGRDESRELVLLAHQPKAVPEAAARGVGLVLAGHTHGGQLWPFSYLVRLDQRYLAGLHRRGDTQVYVSEGTGYWGPPMRLGTVAEITRVVLEPLG